MVITAIVTVIEMALILAYYCDYCYYYDLYYFYNYNYYDHYTLYILIYIYIYIYIIDIYGIYGTLCITIIGYLTK